MFRHAALACCVLTLVAGRALEARAGDTEITIGILNTSASGPIYIAIDRGYFVAEGLLPKLIYFDSAQAIAVATAAGDVDFGTNGLTAALYTLAGQGALRVIGAQVREAPGFRSTALIASNAAYDGGMRSLKDLPGHTVAITQVGSAYQYILNLVAAKYRFDPGTLQLSAVQSLPNIATAVSGGRVDAGVLNAAITMPLVRKDQLKILAWVGDEAPFQIAGLWTSARMADERRSTVEGFLRAYKKGAKAFHDAFTDAGEARADQKTADEIDPILEKYIKLPHDQIAISIAYHDPEARLDVTDVVRQIEWYKAHGMIKEAIEPRSVLDTRYVVPLP